jgi:hypothetical protein
MEPCPNQPTGPPSRCQTLDATVPVDHVVTMPFAQRIWSDDGALFDVVLALQAAPWSSLRG